MKYVFVLAMVCVYAACSDKNNNNANLNDEDVSFMQQASYSNNAEITEGGIANAKGNYDSVRTYGSMMINDHTSAQSIRFTGFCF